MKKFEQFHTIKTGEAKLTNGFWANRVENYADIIDNLEEALLNEENAARMLNFGIAAGEIEGEFYMNDWSDGDCYKFIEGCANQYAVTKDERILKVINKYIPWIEKSQEEDGYIGTQTLLTDKTRWTHLEVHEIYNFGHLFTMACVHYEVTQDDRLLNVAKKGADYLWKLFSPRPKELAHFGTNPSQIMGLVELYEITKDKKYLDLADIFVSMRGESPELGGDGTQNFIPLRDETQPIGHAVKGAYLYAGAMDVYGHTGDKTLLNAIEKIWKDLVKRRIYITGGAGPQYVGISDRGNLVREAFASEYDLPLRVSYNETCANIAVAMWAKRMLQITGEAEYGDWMETIMFNAGISGSSLDMKRYFYSNPLAHRANHHIEPTFQQYTHVPNERFFTFDCWCCPPQLLRTFTGMPKWIYSLSDSGVAINLFGGSELNTTLKSGEKVAMNIVTNYPWDEKIAINIENAPKDMDLTFRIPAWCENATLNSKAITCGMHTIKVNSGDTIMIVLPMQAQLYTCDPLLEQSNGMFAVKRGPVVYCLEGSDIENNISIDELTIPEDTQFTETTIDEFPYGMVGLKADLVHRPQGQGLYQPAKNNSKKKVSVRFIPYFSWANREEQDMSVWLPRA